MLYSPQKCKSCDGSGYSPEAKKISDDWYTHLRTDGKKGWSGNITQDEVQALIDADRLWDFTRVALNDEHREIIKKKIEDGGNSWLPFNNGYVPTAEEVNIWASFRGFGHDSSNHYTCVKQRCKRLGIELFCKTCDGEGSVWFSERIRELNEKWYDDEKYEPPTGEAYQLWETVSEGSPVTPPFATPEEVADWLVANDDSITRDTSREDWVKFIREEGEAVTMISDGKEIKSGVAAMSEDL